MALSARTDSALRQIAGSFAEHLQQHPTAALADACYSINTGRNAFSHRAAVIAESPGELCQRLAALAKGERASGVRRSRAALPHRPQVAFLFSGQGSQYPGMARQLFETHPVFREVIIQVSPLRHRSGWATAQ
jgi:acyl transferase domain-containing protein